jgi:hypothetical protein
MSIKQIILDVADEIEADPYYQGKFWWNRNNPKGSEP